jgi:hypothetical protein
MDSLIVHVVDCKTFVYTTAAFYDKVVVKAEPPAGGLPGIAGKGKHSC